MTASPDYWRRICAGHALRAVVPVEDGKLLLPVSPGADVAALINGHLAGHLPPVPILCSDGRTWTEHRARAIAVCPVLPDGTVSWLAWDFDVVGDGHATGADAQTTDRVTGSDR